MEIVFVRTRHHYDSYVDYWRLVDLAGFPICYVDEIDWDAPVFYILSPMNGEYCHDDVVKGHHAQNRPSDRRCRVAWWNLERPDSGPGRADQLLGSMVCNDTTRMFEIVDHIWVSDRYTWKLDERTTFVIFGSDHLLASGKRKLPLYDFCHLSYVNHRRSKIFSRLQQFRIGPNCWGPERSQVLNASRAILNVHQTDALIGEPLRFALAAAYGVPLFSEILEDPYPLIADGHVLMADADDLPVAVDEWLQQDFQSLESLGAQLKARLCDEFPFSEQVLNGMSKSLVESSV